MHRLNRWRATSFAAVVLLLCACRPPQPDVGVPAPVDAVSFFIRFGPDLLVPLGCKRLDASTWESGRACLALLEADSTLRVESLGDVRAAGPAPTQCAETGRGTTALRFSSLDAGPLSFPKGPEYGVWSSGEPVRVRRLSDAPPASQILSDPALTALWPDAETTHVLQQVPVDVNQDGIDETVLVLTHGALADDVLDGVQSAVALRQGDETLILHAPADGRLQLLGLLDLDGNGTQEAWLRVDTEASRTDRLESWTSAGVVEIGSWGCP